MKHKRIVYRIAKHLDGHVQLIVEGINGGDFNARLRCGFVNLGYDLGYDTVSYLPRHRALTL